MGARRFSRLMGGLRVGADFFERRKLVTTLDPAPRGVVDRVADLAHAGIDVARVHPAIAVFFEDTAALELLIESRWRFPFSLGWRVFRSFMRAIGQFVLPIDRGTILTRVFAIDRAHDGRDDARAVVRTYADSGATMQAVAYATCESDGVRVMSAAFPMPLGHVGGLLRLDPIGEDDDGRLAVELTSRGRGAGVWLVVGPLAIPSPFGEQLELWAAHMPCPIDPATFERATILGRHRQTLFGVRFVEHHYWFRPLAKPDRALPPRT
jgi:hypothetical protein